MAVGGVVGLALGVAAGVAIYWGLVSIPMRQLFTVTSWLVLLLAAGLASQGAAFLMQADLLPPLGANVWDTSFLLSDQSLPGAPAYADRLHRAARRHPAGVLSGDLAVIGVLMRARPGRAATVGRADTGNAAPAE